MKLVCVFTLICILSLANADDLEIIEEMDLDQPTSSERSQT